MIILYYAPLKRFFYFLHLLFSHYYYYHHHETVFPGPGKENYSIINKKITKNNVIELHELYIIAMKKLLLYLTVLTCPFFLDIFKKCKKKIYTFTYYLKQSKISSSYIIKVYFHILPSGTLIAFYEFQTLSIIVDITDIEHLTSCGVDTVIEFSSKKIYSHDAED